MKVGNVANTFFQLFGGGRRDDKIRTRTYVPDWQRSTFFYFLHTEQPSITHNIPVGMV